MEELNKNQLILLALLVSFVTSMATGIVTVALMEDSPNNVPQTIYRVVEKTVERVVPGETKTETETIVREVPVVITEEKLIIDAVDKVSPGIGRLLVVKETEQAEEAEEIFAGPIFNLAIGNRTITMALTPQATGTKYRVSFEGQKKKDISIAATSQSESLTTYDLPPAEGLKGIPLASDDLNIGQTVVAISIDSLGYSVAVGVSSGFTTTNEAKLFRTNAAKDNRGAVLININGELVGLSMGDGTALYSEEINSFIDSL